ncbi:mitochondrial import receptor subunit TOM20-1-like [Tripterygium wilfordii]|uniref:mitochondrial import receptor subunit TOM20-1-like n=1 Tax=Tripterygium wilfordii TaxID=458696 RepID=UPI0018F85EF6|nr:mitochondrial import receptor subunit TOM20-1-like [Tripterygium wilfordii]XP_038703558.1 mitochondrial import receptor subunit TOM20-1-like [Tripterygium wilfordii]
MPFRKNESSRNQEVPFLKEDRLPYFANICAAAETRYNKNPRDTKNLSQWGEALIGLAVLMNNIEPQQLLLRDAIKKLNEALSINDKVTDTHFVLGLAYHKYAILTKEYDKALPCYQSAHYSFTIAHNQDWHNEVYSEWMRSCHPCRSTHESWHDIRLRIMTGRPIIPTSDEEPMCMMDKIGWLLQWLCLL